MMQKALSQIPEVFGELEKGSLENPAITKESVHHFFKYVSGKPLIRPAWFFDVEQQGEGIADVSTHLVDLVFWECFPEKIIDYEQDIEILAAKRWPTELSPEQFNKVTGLSGFPDYLQKDIIDGTLHVYSNGEINFAVKGVHAKVSVIWNYQAPAGAADTHYSIMRGTKANLVIRQGADQNYKPVLYVEPVNEAEATALPEAIKKIAVEYPGLSFKESENGWEIQIPDEYKVGHEAHFAQVTEKYLQYLIDGKLPEWEVPNMLAKYYVTTKAYELSRKDPQ
jgi:predicted dehydrogenase